MRIALASLFVFAVLVSIPSVFAEEYIIKIPTGAASPDAPYFWQVEKTGATDGDITIDLNDSVSWENADTAAHTVTSGKATEGPDGIFDSGLYGPGQTFTYSFDEEGTYPYFCLVHPWMVGTVVVGSGVDNDDDDDDGNDNDNGSGNNSNDQNKRIQQLQDENARLKSEVNDLKLEVEELKKEIDTLKDQIVAMTGQFVDAITQLNQWFRDNLN